MVWKLGLEHHQHLWVINSWSTNLIKIFIDTNDLVHSDSADLTYLSNQSLTRNRNDSSLELSNNWTKYSTLELDFKIKEKHIIDTNGKLSLKCTAEVLDLYWRSSEVSVTVTSIPRPWFSPDFSISSAVSCQLSNYYLSISIAFYIINFKI